MIRLIAALMAIASASKARRARSRPQRLVEEAHAQDHSGDEPQSIFTGKRGPGQQVEGGGAEQVTGEEHEARRRGACGGDRGGAPAPAELACKQAGQEDGQASRESRRQSQHRERVRRDLAHATSDQRGRWPLVGPPPVQVMTGRKEVGLVAVIAVPRGERHQHRRRHRGDETTPLLCVGRPNSSSFSQWRLVCGPAERGNGALARSWGAFSLPQPSA